MSRISLQLAVTDNCHEHICIYVLARLFLVMFAEP